MHENKIMETEFQLTQFEINMGGKTQPDKQAQKQKDDILLHLVFIGQKNDYHERYQKIKIRLYLPYRKIGN